MKKDEKQEAINLIHRELIDRHLLRTCITCGNWDEKVEQCYKYSARPPAQVIVLGCEEWIMDIPF